MKNYPIFQAPKKIEQVIYLIKEELKIRKLFQILHTAGMTECDYEPHLDSLIFKAIGMDYDDDALSNKYFDIIEKRSKKLKPDRKAMVKQAFKAYQEILALKKESIPKRK
ncbi:MAG: hypothetical protein DI539_24155 [Flavobacterium psychrophilum]|nr:MAG: hypothetical protein DI539_24155 [Flavobacterium psychrophilum]